MMIRWIVAGMAALVIALSVFRLEAEQAGLVHQRLTAADGTPVILTHLQGAKPAPVVVVAHGFAGSMGLMEPLAITLARAGYIVVRFDFAGHGQNPEPMRGAVDDVSGVTAQLVAQMQGMARLGLAQPLADGRLAFVGHSMASDIAVRAADAPDLRAEASVLISAFSPAITAETPRNLLLVSGGWETGLRAAALQSLRLTHPEGDEGDLTLGDPAMGTARAAVVAQGVEHLGVLYDATTRTAARDWLDMVFDRPPMTDEPAARGVWIMLLMAATLGMAWPLAGMLPRSYAFGGWWGVTRHDPVPAGAFWSAALVPAVMVPLVLQFLQMRFLPVLVADYLALHGLCFGGLALLQLARWGRMTGQFPRLAVIIALGVALFGIGGFGLVVDHYVTSFFPDGSRLWVIAVLALGMVPVMLADAILTEGGRATWVRVLVARGAYLGSLGLAVGLDMERLMFVAIIMPVILVFFLIFGTIGGWVGRQTGLPAAGGIGLGLTLAWALGATFPMLVN